MDILEQIIQTKKEEVKNLKKKFSITSFNGFKFFNQQAIKFSEILKRSSDLSIIAEIKKASPSKGILKNNFDHLEIANTYLRNKVSAISILTDEKYFQGSINYLEEIAEIKNVPLLRKEFIIDEFQIFQSKAFGADFILLIAEALTKTQIKDYTQIAAEIGLEVLLEIHSANELGKIDFNINNLIGINNRDLKTFKVDLNTTINIKKHIPKHILTISESGISKQDDIERLIKSKINGILVGEYLMRSEDLQNELTQLKEWCKIEG